MHAGKAKRAKGEQPCVRVCIEPYDGDFVSEKCNFSNFVDTCYCIYLYVSDTGNASSNYVSTVAFFPRR